MSNNDSSSKKGSFSTVVSSNIKVGERFYKLQLNFGKDAAAAFDNCQPGQFAELDLSAVALPPKESIPSDLRDAAARTILLRRPFSFSDVTVQPTKGSVEIVYQVLGPGSLRMTTLVNGDSINIIGPLGKGFQVSEDKKFALLVAGGMGVPPLQHLAKFMTERHPNIETIAFVGAKTLIEMPFKPKLDEVSQQLGFMLPEFAKYGIESVVATDDGSVGYAGFITDCLCQWLEKTESCPKDIAIFSCGPEPMLAKVAQIAEKRNIDCQVSMERMMACGIGLCQSCAVECKTNSGGETVYKLCCKDGPVFNSREVAFAPVSQ